MLPIHSSHLFPIFTLYTAQLSISIVIPSYRSSEALRKNLPYLLQYLNDSQLDHEVIVVDDGSNDNGETEGVAKELGCRFLTYPNNLGKGGAVRFGMQHATKEIRLYTDADIPFETAAIDKIIYYLSEKEYDVVIGDRGLEESNYFNEISAKRRFGSGFFTFIVGRFITTGISDTQCGLKGFRAPVADDLFRASRINGFTFDVELMYISLKRNYDIKKIPVTLRSQDGSSVSVLRHGFGMVMDLFRIKRNHMMGKYTKR
jgi:dolichyl-phosphate beta-glucosyltransferase